MSVPNNYNYPTNGNNPNFQTIPFSNDINAINTIPFNQPNIINNNTNINYNIINPYNTIQYGATYPFQIPITENTFGANSPIITNYNIPITQNIPNQIIYNNNTINTVELSQNRSGISRINRSNHRRQRTEVLNYYNPLSNNLIIDEDMARERPFYNRPKEKLPEKKEFKNVNTFYNANFSNYAYTAYLLQKEREKKYEKKMKRVVEEVKKDIDKKQTYLKDPINDGPNPPKKPNNDKIIQMLEDMCVYGNIEKMQLKAEKEKHPEKYINTQDALKMEQQDPELFALGLLSSILEENKIETFIEKEESKKEEEENIATTSMQFLTNGLIGKKKYDLYFDAPEEKLDKLIFDENEFNKFKEDLKNKLNQEYGIPKEKIIITFPQRGSLHVQVIFQSDEFNDLDLDDFKLRFQKDDEFTQMYKLKRVYTGLIMGGCRLSKRQLDPKGNRQSDWGKNEMRGREPYYPPEGWIGIGIKVFDQYFNDKWIDMQNKEDEDEWVVAYHGVGRGLCTKDVNGIPNNIIGMGFKAGKGQAHKNCEDQFHPGNKVGEGIYCTPFITTAEHFAGESEINGKKYKTVIMVRVKPSARRHCDKCEESRVHKYWVVNGTTDEIRPYRILFKKC